MAYSCVKHNKNECDGCGECQEDFAYKCFACDEGIAKGEIYYDYGDRTYCERCNELAKEMR